MWLGEQITERGIGNGISLIIFIGIVADDRGYIYVADRLKSAVIIFDKNFKFLHEFGYRGRKSYNLIAPNDLDLDNQGRLYVSQLASIGVSVFNVIYK